MTALAHTFFSLPNAERVTIKATERRLEQVYAAAKQGLKGDSLAVAAGMLPIEFNRLKQMDPLVELAILKGRTDGEQEMAGVLIAAAHQGDAKAALDVLKHVHGWSAAQQLNVSVQGQISITDALKQAERRVIEGVYTQFTEIPQNDEKVRIK